MKGMSPRHALPRRAVLAVAFASLAGCGFELRKAPQFSFKSIAVSSETAFANQVKRNLRATGTLEVLPANQAANAEVVLDILGENRDNVIISTNTAGQVRELQLRLTVRYRLRAKGGKELLAPAEIQQTRDITYNETAALAKEGETELLFRDMQTDIAQQLLRRLAAAKPA
jgi:LPS-assembly lipoprotein